MKLTDNQKIIAGALLTAILVVVFQAFAAYGIPIVVPPTPAPVDSADVGARAITRTGIICDSGTNCVESRYGKNLAVYSDNGSTLKFKVTGSSGTVQHGGFDVVNAATSITVTDGITNLTPLGSYQPIAAAGTVTVTSMLADSTFTTGTRVRFINTSNQSIVFTNGTYLKLPSATNLTLGQYDVLELWFDGTRWICTGTSNN